MLPLLMLLLLFGLDFGRVFLGDVNLNNTTKVAANFAAQNPTAWNAAPNANDLAVQAEYQRLVTTDATGTNCTLPSPIPTPDFPSGTGIGSTASVRISCSFSLITPVISNIVGNSLTVSASAAFPIRAGVIAGIPVAAAVPTPTATPIPTPVGTPTPTPLATPAPTPVPLCIVPNLIGVNTQQADRYWGTNPGQGAGFTTPVIFNPAVGQGNNNNYVIGSQNPRAGQSLPCNSTSITVTP